MDEGLRKGEVKQQQQPWRVLEFYSGIGGMRYSLMDAGVDAQVVEAFDINDVANDVYQHNFSHRPYQGNIQTLSCADLDNYNADAWLLSPPCQPYTRQGLQKGSDDARAFSFLKILELIPHCSRAPLMLFVENVVGFETSDTHEKMVAMLRENHFEIQEFILSPLQFAVPYSRPRYFCLAKRRPMYFQNAQYNNKLLCAPDLVLGHDKNIVTSKVSVGHVRWDKFIETCRPIQEFLEFKDSASELISDAVGSSISRISKDTEEGTVAINNTLNAYIVPPNLVERWGSAMGPFDLKLFLVVDVFHESKRCCCFTKSYYRYVKGTGSLLATVQGKTTDKANSLLELRLRYFTPKEVANLHSFPDHFQFPQHVSLRQRYALLGNSLSVGVVAPLLKYLFSHDES